MATETALIQLKIDGEAGVRSTLEQLRSLLDTVEGRHKIDIATDEAKSKIIALDAEMKKLRTTMENSDKKSDVYKTASQNLKATRQEARLAQTEYKVLNKAQQEGAKIAREEAKAQREAEKAMQAKAKASEQAAKAQEKEAAAAQKAAQQEARRQAQLQSYEHIYNKISSKAAHMGSAMQSMGNALTQLTSPFKRITDGMLMGAGYKVLGKFTDGLENGFERYDTMKKYPKIMAAFGYSNEESQKSIDALDKSVRGLPTSLNDMVDMAQRFIATTGDMNKGTKLAIAANNAFLASMSTDTQKYQGMMQLQDVLGGKDMNAREWNSLVSSMTPAIVKMGESLGYTKDNMDEFIQTVRDGNMSNEEFIDNLIKIGNEGGVLEAMAQESKDTWQAFFANVGNAASRLTAGIIQGIDEVTQVMTGQDFNQYLASTIIPGIDKMTESVKGWIRSHPDEISNFFKTMSQIKWSSLLKGWAEGMMTLAGLLEKVASLGAGRDLSWIGRWGVYLNKIGRALTIFGGIIKGSRGIFGFLGGKILSKYGKKGIIGKLIDLIGGTKGTKELAEAPKAMDTMRNVFKSLEGVLKVAGTIGISAATVTGATWAIRQSIHNLKVIGDEIGQVDWGHAATGVEAFGVFTMAMVGIGKYLNKLNVAFADLKGIAIAGGVSAFLAFVLSGDMQLLAWGAEGLAKMAKNIDKALKTFKEIKDVDIDGLGSKVANVMDAVAVIYSGVKGNTKTDRWGLGSIRPKDIQDLEATAKSLQGTITALGDISQQIIDLSNKTLPTQEQMDAISSSLSTVIGGLDKMLTAIPEGMGSKGTAKGSAYLSNTLNSLKEGFAALIGDDGIIAQLPQMASKAQRLQHGGQIDNLVNQMQRLGQGLKDVMNALNFGGFDATGFASDVMSIDSALDNIKSIIGKLKSIGKQKVDTSGTANIGSYVENLKSAFSQEKVGSLIGTITAFVATVQAALQTIEQLNQEVEVDVTFKLSQGFYDSKKKVIDEIKKGKKQIQNQKGNISVTIPVRVWFNVITNAAAAVAKITKDRWKVQREATGQAGPITAGPGQSMGGLRTRSGVLYRSGGGFAPRGTDTVPAMLTPGEYVHKKQAVDFFGVDFMRKVNNMDVRGAMSALLSKAGTNVGVGRQSIVNNTVNNNQRITQNINTNNPNFARARMGRFVGAL